MDLSVPGSKESSNDADSRQADAAVALLGGTFDPIHRGHTQPALELADLFGWSHIHVQPCFAPPHRSPPQVSDEHRLHMVRLACADDPRLIADDFELRRGAPTRTVHTLTHLAQVHGNKSLCFMLGMDSFINFTSWLNWTGILELAHLIVLPRPGYKLSQAPAALHQQLLQRRSNDVTDFCQGAGRIFIANTTPRDISATELREHLAGRTSASQGACPELLAPQVYAYIQAHHLYRK